ncbi:MAG TPA: type II toxin-antitoxin system Phd/YefM family antitoxin [Allocoleopsis sp.]
MIIPNQQQFTVEYARQNFNEVMEFAEKEAIILTQNQQKFLLINQEVLESWLETIAILQEPNILDDIKAAKSEYQQEKTLTMDDIFG